MEQREQRLFEEFKELAEIDSVSLRERQMADRLKEKLAELGFEVMEDQVGSLCGGNAGNVYGFLKGDLDGDPILFSSHMDTVEPGAGKRVILKEDGQIVSDGTTVLGSDDVAGIVGILDGVRNILREGKSHRDIEVLFPIGEEIYGCGSAAFDYSTLKSKEAYVLDLSGAIGTAAVQAPTLISFDVEVEGKASHAGFAPEKGIHAIKIMSKAIVNLRQGHLDDETTLNIGLIQGGSGSNIVPELATCKGEIRSYDHEKALEALEYVKKLFEDIAEAEGAHAKLQSEVKIRAYHTPEDSCVVQRFQKACEKMELPGTLIRTFGGSDQNNFSERGIEGIVLSCGMYQVHSTKEYSYVQDLVKCAEMVEELILSEM